jgi:hypothetical protein
LFCKKTKFLFRPKEDTEFRRNETTPDEDTLKSNFDALYEYAGRLFQGKSFLKRLLKTIETEKKHAPCLANMSPEMQGTKPNEAFHSSLKRRMTVRGNVHTKMGLAQLYTTIFYLYEVRHFIHLKVT